MSAPSESSHGTSGRGRLDRPRGRAPIEREKAEVGGHPGIAISFLSRCPIAIPG